MADQGEKRKPCDHFSPDTWRKSRCKMCFWDKKDHVTISKQPAEERKNADKKPPGRFDLGEHAVSPGLPSEGSPSFGTTPSRPRIGSADKQSSPASPMKDRPTGGGTETFKPPLKAETDQTSRFVAMRTAPGSKAATPGGKASAISLSSSSDEGPHRTVLLIGKTGDGKSTVANVLAGTHTSGSKREMFKEGGFGVSETDNAVLEAVKVPFGDNAFVTYHIVDTIGIGDTAQPADVVLMKLARACTLVRHGINQILFVTAKKFTTEEEEAFNIMRSVIFTPDVCKYITIVKTNFPKFRDYNACQKDIELMTESKGMRDSVKSIFTAGPRGGCAKIIHVDNPDDNNPDWVKIRNKSREYLLARLEGCDEVYCPESLEKVSDRVGQHLEEGEHLGRDIKAMKEHFRKEKDKQEQYRVQLAKEVEKKAEQMIKQQQRLQAEVEKREQEHQAALERMRTEVDERERENAKKMAEEAERRASMLLEEQRRLADSLAEQQRNLFEQQEERDRKHEEERERYEEALREIEAKKEAAEERARQDLAKIWQENAEHCRAMEKSAARQKELELMIQELRGEGVFRFIKRKIFG